MLQTELIAPVSELLERHKRERPDKVAYWDAARSVTYAELGDRTASIAVALARRGLREGDRVAIYLPNSVDWMEACLAGLRAGAVIVPISYDAANAEIAYRLSDSDCGLIITTPARSELIKNLSAETGGRFSLVFAGSGAREAGLSLEELARGIGEGPLDPADIDRSSFIIYTSGTTGRAKGVLLSVRGMLWIAASCWAPILGFSDKDVVLSPLPLFHSYALNLSVLSVLAVGASEHILGRFSPQSVLELLQAGKFTFFPGVPTMFHYLLQRARETGIRKLGNTRLCFSAGAIMPATLNKAFEAHFGTTLLDGYGITETSTMVTVNWMTGTRIMGSCGLPVPGLAVRIVDPVTIEDLPVGAEGELIVRGPNLMHGYHNKPVETASALKKGWYHTGDPREIRSQRLFDDHRPYQGTDRQGRAEHRACRNRRGRHPPSSGTRLRRGRGAARDSWRGALSVRGGRKERARRRIAVGALPGEPLVLQNSGSDPHCFGNPTHGLRQNHAVPAGGSVEAH